MAALAHPDHRRHAVLIGQQQVQAEPVHAQQRPGDRELLQVIQVGAIAAVSEHHPPRIDFLLGQNPQRIPTTLVRRRGVDADRRIALTVHATHRAHDSLDVLGQTGGVDSAFQDPRFHSAAFDALLRSESIRPSSGSSPSRIVPGPEKCHGRGRTS